MVMRRQCNFRLPSGESCRAAPLRNSEFCRMHSPEYLKEVQEARRLGGLRRKRESTISSAYQFESLDSVDGDSPYSIDWGSGCAFFGEQHVPGSYFGLSGPGGTTHA